MDAERAGSQICAVPPRERNAATGVLRVKPLPGSRALIRATIKRPEGERMALTPQEKRGPCDRGRERRTHGPEGQGFASSRRWAYGSATMNPHGPAFAACKPGPENARSARSLADVAARRERNDTSLSRPFEGVWTAVLSADDLADTWHQWQAA